MATINQGDEKKFAIELTAPGFDIDNNDFDLEVKSSKVSIKASKGASTEALRIFYEEEAGVRKWYAIVDTTTLTSGQIDVIATAHIPDANANDGIRRESATAVLGTLKVN